MDFPLRFFVDVGFTIPAAAWRSHGKDETFQDQTQRATLAVVCIVVLALAAFFVYRGVSGDCRGGGDLHHRDRPEDDPHLLDSRHRQHRAVRHRVSQLRRSRRGHRPVSRSGDTVEKGQVLFTLVNPQLDVAVAEAQNAYDKALLAVDQAKLSVLSAKTSSRELYNSEPHRSQSSRPSRPSRSPRLISSSRLKTR